MISFFGREDRVTKSGGPVTTLNLFILKGAMKSSAFQPKPLGSKQGPSQKAKFAREGCSMEQQPSCPSGAVLLHLLCLLHLLELMQVPFLTSVSNHSAQVGRDFLRSGSLYTSSKILLEDSHKGVSQSYFGSCGEWDPHPASLSWSGFTANQVVCTSWDSPSLFIFAKSLQLWDTQGMIWTERS